MCAQDDGPSHTCRARLVVPLSKMMLQPLFIKRYLRWQHWARQHPIPKALRHVEVRQPSAHAAKACACHGGRGEMCRVLLYRVLGREQHSRALAVRVTVEEAESAASSAVREYALWVPLDLRHPVARLLQVVDPGTEYCIGRRVWRLRQLALGKLNSQVRGMVEPETVQEGSLQGIPLLREMCRLMSGTRVSSVGCRGVGSSPLAPPARGPAASRRLASTR